ncbi:DUF11 domain-containing protein [Clostridium botulinum C]|uniref:DUF11 domain-containing protein n=3 Tax=Clostridium botulinum TaxID=1491 RepID=A0A9Q4XUS5_CLOBO|nr:MULTISPECIES: DUF11 domain-containing protein [Clostridium]AYF53266.1 DUF11 domain-containing protein [Clostridium novyi]EES90873.1 conserved repeat domain protein [Clostridium botulinum D str. 1873]KEI06595.1 hypothetical protein Z957_12065 [Clostridium sp. K25]MBO3442803.1 DUF11 domain-containing protein [Clostridium haemolyticum]MCD3193886.1 DUF11 domain-containing protein [Clostridium botulinum C]
MENMNQFQCCCTGNTNSIQVQNQGSYSSKVTVSYMSGGTQVNVDSGNIPSCTNRQINIPTTANNLQFNIQICNCGNWVSLYSNTLNGSSSFTILLTGTVNSPKYNIVPLQVESTQTPIITVAQTVEPSVATIGQCITLTTTVTNTQGTNANGVCLMLTPPVGSTFIPGSLQVNNCQLCLSELPASGISLGNVAGGQSVTVQYQVLYNLMPSQNEVINKPTISYSYVGSNGSNQVNTVTGTTTSLKIVSDCEPLTSGCCCCCCCCKPNDSGIYNSSDQCMM